MPIGKLEIVPGTIDNGTVTVRKNCTFCNKPAEVQNVSLEGVNLWADGTGPSIQNVFPTMDAEDREVLLSGTHPSCWNKMFPPDDDDEDWEEVPDIDPTGKEN
jgi:hypothetical protein